MACNASTSDPNVTEGLIHTHAEKKHDHDHGHDHDHDHNHEHPKVEVYINEAEELRKAGSCCPNMAPFVLMLALSVHAIFEGLAVGLAPSL